MILQVVVFFTPTFSLPQIFDAKAPSLCFRIKTSAKSPKLKEKTSVCHRVNTGPSFPSGDLYGEMIILPEKLRFACLVVGKFGINIPEMVVNSGEEW